LLSTGAILKIPFASFYNANAGLERLFATLDAYD